MSQSIAIGMIGYKFMGKAHSNAYRQISQFFDLPLKPRLKTISGRDKPKVEKMAERWGWENAVDDWRKIREVEPYRRSEESRIDNRADNASPKRVATHFVKHLIVVEREAVRLSQHVMLFHGNILPSFPHRPSRVLE